ncbi:MAG: hypothetical protein NTW19_10320 [Planctomycetota bacterium]|nr:hypothetical protein [Planctomycetota bacterium]
MNEKTLAAVALSNRDYPTFADKLHEAARWVEFAGDNGADLVVLPELLNLYRGDGAGNAAALPLEDVALDDWRAACGPILEAAARARTAVVVPVATREPAGLTNSFFLVDKAGRTAGRYQKSRLTPSEVAAGVLPGQPSLIEWEGLKVGGAICFDCYHPEVFSAQAQLGAQLFVVPSLTPAEAHLSFYALHHGLPIVQAYPAWSRIIDVTGRDLAAGGHRNETLNFGFGSPVIFATINFNRVALFADVNQQKILDVQRAHRARVRIAFDQANVTFVLESRDPALSVESIVREFGLVPRGRHFTPRPA